MYSWIEQAREREKGDIRGVGEIRTVVLYLCWLPNLEGWVQGRESVLFVGNYTLEYLWVTGHHVCSLLSKSWKIMTTGMHIYIYTHIRTHTQIICILGNINLKLLKKYYLFTGHLCIFFYELLIYVLYLSYFFFLLDFKSSCIGPSWVAQLVWALSWYTKVEGSHKKQLMNTWISGITNRCFCLSLKNFKI